MSTLSPIPRIPRPMRVASQVEQLARSLGPGAKLPTFEEICVRFDTSRATLSLALKSLETRGVVVRRRGSGLYTPSRAKQSMVAIVMGLDPARSLTSPFYRLLIDALVRQFAGRGLEAEVYTGVQHETKRLWEGCPAEVSLRQPIQDDLLYGTVHITGWDVDVYFQSRGIPVTGVNSYLRPGFQTVGIDNASLIQAGVDSLHAMGRQKLALLGAATTTRFERRDSIPGIADAFDPGLMGIDDGTKSRDELGYQIGKMLAEKLRNEPGRWDGLVVTDDFYARGALVALTRAGLALGRELCVASHVNKGSNTLVGFEQDLIRLVIDPAQIAAGLVAQLDRQRAGDRGERLDLLVPQVDWPSEHPPRRD